MNIKSSNDVGVQPIGVKPKAATRLGIGGLTTIYDLLGRGELESYQIGRSRFITIKSIEAYIARRLTAAQAGKA
jgi:excisionase family DNA binding protein